MTTNIKTFGKSMDILAFGEESEMKSESWTDWKEGKKRG